MGDLVNLRTARKRAKRSADDRRADANRLAHGRSNQQRKLADAQRHKASQDLDGHWLDSGDGR
jgi:Domain of unknown function (DUF4169)